MKRSIFYLLLLFVTEYACGQDRTAAFSINERLGKGINMGNSFEAPSESAWGNPWKPEYFETIAAMGFQHVRLPIRWEPSERSLASAPYTITETFLERIKEVVDEALANDLMIMINMHHHELLFDQPELQKERFLSQWSQIATYFKDYPDDLLFEVLNEPHGNISPQLWNVYFADALEVIRESNPNRIVLMGTAEYGGLSGVPYLELPNDENIIVSVHYYNPFNFTHQGAEWVGSDADAWLGTKWNDTEAERETIIKEFEPLIALSEEENIPIHIGEFGAYSKADLESRTGWTNFLARWFEEQGFSWAYWEFSAGFGIYNPATGEILQPLLDALVVNEMQEPVATEAILLYQSNFEQGADGWSLQVQNGSTANLDATSGQLRVEIENAGTEGWHVQLTKNNIALYEERMYKVTVKAVADSERSMLFYAGKASDPWNNYSGYDSYALTAQEVTYSKTFTMGNPTDANARLVFDIGKSMETVEIRDVRLEEIRLIEETETPVVTSVKLEAKKPLNYFPNPVESTLHLTNAQEFDKAVIYSIYGTKKEVFKLNGSKNRLDLTNYSTGIYLVVLEGHQQEREKFLIIKD